MLAVSCSNGFTAIKHMLAHRASPTCLGPVDSDSPGVNVVRLCGSPGVGKSRLAHEVAPGLVGNLIGNASLNFLQ